MKRLFIIALLFASSLYTQEADARGRGAGGWHGRGGHSAAAHVRGGWHHHHRHHGHARVGVGVGFGFGFGSPFYFGSPYYFGSPWYPTAIAVPVEAPITYIERDPPADESPAHAWYFCPSAWQYYPTVGNCDVAWVPVEPRPAVE